MPDFLTALTDALFVLIFALVGLQALRHPLRATVDTALLFGTITAFIGLGWVSTVLHITDAAPVIVVTQTLLIGLPYLLLRLVDDFGDVPPGVLRGAAGGLILSVISFVVVPAGGRPTWLTLLYVAYFVGLTVYSAILLGRETRRASGVTKRRMWAVAVGSVCLGLVILLIGIQVVAPAWAFLWGALERLCAVGTALAYFVGFAPPRWLRRSWQEPDVTAFLRQGVRLTRLTETGQIVRALAASAAQALGANHAVIYLWDAQDEVLRADVDGVIMERKMGQMLSGQVFASQRALFCADALRDDPANAALYRAYHAKAALVAPMTVGDTQVGVLLAYAARPSIFAEDDLALAEMLAEQAAIVLDSHTLREEAARVQARAESARIKEEFLAAAAHDLKTPLTGILGWAQLLERRAADGTTPADLDVIRRIVQSTRRMRQLISDLLDAARLEHGQFVGQRERTDLTALVREVCDAHSSGAHRIVLTASEPVAGLYDAGRIAQVVENLIGNAIKYSPDGGIVSVCVQRQGGDAYLTVADTGIGIPADDLPHLFERFHRGSNAQGPAFLGIGLGLFICHTIVTQHGGSLWATSPGVGQGSTFHVRLPACSP